MILYHGGTDIVETPIIRRRTAGRDFGMGFYCTEKSLACLGYTESL